MAFMLRRVYQGFLFHPDAVHVHPLVGMLILGLQFMILIVNDISILVLLFFLVVLENMLYNNLHDTLSLFRAIIPLLIFLGILSFIFGGLIRAFLIILRLLIGAFSCSFFFAVTNPSDLTRILEKCKFPPKWALLPALALTMVPRVAKDAEETFETLTLRGEIRGFFLRWLPKILSIFVASVLYRSEFLAQSLYFRGFEIQKRSHYRTVNFRKIDIIRLLTWIFFLILIMYI
ncbi:MAG: energy-coupling factor transporter transmembrane component T family protein [Promethearchaeota archaeon]